MLNNPYVPGDPYSYDLKWLVARVKEILAQLGTLDEAIEKKIFEGFLEHSVVQFKTVAEMLAADIVDGSIVLTLGYHEAGDQGGLFYLVKDFNPDQCALDYFLTLDNNKQIAIPVIVTPYVTPEMFGAYGDGSTDDSDAVRICLEKYNNVYLGDKTYKITESMTVKSNSVLRGSTKNSAILTTVGNFGAIASINSEEISNFVMRDFTLLVPDSFTGKALCFEADGSYHDIYRFSVENVVVRHETLNPQPVTTNNGIGIHLSGALSGLFSGVYLHDFDEAVKCEYVSGRTTGANSITFIGGEIQSCNTGLSASGLRNASFVNFTMEGCLTTAAHLTGGCEGVSFMNNYLEGNGTNDFLLDKTVLNEPNKSITFDGIVGRPSSTTASMFKLISAVGVSVRNCSARGGYAYTQFVENAAASPEDVIGTIEGTTDLFNNQYAISPFDETLHPSATKLIDKMTMFMKPVDRDFFDNNYTDVTNTAGTETTLRTITIPANFLTRFGGVVEILIAGDYTGSSSANKSFKFNINGATAKTTTTTQASGSWLVKIKLVANYDQTVRAIYEFSDQGMSDRVVAAQGNITGSNIVIALTGTCTAAAIRARQSYWKNA